MNDHRGELSDDFEVLIEEKVAEHVEEHIQKAAADLQRTNEQLREENNQLRARVSELENRPTVELRSNGENTYIENLWIGDLPVGVAIENRQEETKELDERYWDLNERVGALERGELDPSDIMDLAGSENDLPIQHITAARKSETHDLDGNKLRATYVWPEFHTRAQSSSGKLVLSGWQVKNILSENGLDTNSNTVRRTMQFMAKLTSQKPREERDPKDPDNLVTFHDESRKNVLRADKSEWLAFFGDQVEAATQPNDSLNENHQDDDPDANADGDDVDEELQQLVDGEAVTSSAEDSVEGTIGGQKVDE